MHHRSVPWPTLGPQSTSLQSDDWRDGVHRPLPFRRADVDAASVDETLLSP